MAHTTTSPSTILAVTPTRAEIAALARACNVLTARSATLRLDVARNGDTLSHTEACRLLAVAERDQEAAETLFALVNSALPGEAAQVR